MRTVPASRATRGRSWKRRSVEEMFRSEFGVIRMGELPALQRDATVAVPVARFQVRDPKACQLCDIRLWNENSRLRYRAVSSGTFSMRSKKAGAVADGRYRLTGTSGEPSV